MKRAFYHSILVSLLGIALNFSFKILISHLIAKELLALYFTTIDVFTLTLLVLVGFRSSMVVAFSQFQNAQNIINIFRGVLLVVILAVWGLVIPFLKHKMGVDIHYWYLVATLISMSLVLYFSNLIAMYRLYNVMNIVALIEPLFLLIWFCIAYFIAQTRGIQPLFIATIMSSLMVAFYTYIMKRRFFPTISFARPKLEAKEIEFIKNSVISTIEFGSGIVLLYLVVFFIMHYYSLDELGDFQVVTKPIFSYMVMLFVFPIFRFVLPELSKLYRDKEIQKIKSLKNWILRFAFIVSGLFIVISLLAGDEIIGILFSQEYAGAALMVKHLSFFFIFLILNAYQVAFIKASGAFMSALLIRLIGIVSIIVLFYSIYTFYSQSIISIIVSLVMSYMIMFGVSYAIERRIMKRLERS